MFAKRCSSLWPKCSQNEALISQMNRHSLVEIFPWQLSRTTWPETHWPRRIIRPRDYASRNLRSCFFLALGWECSSAEFPRNYARIPKPVSTGVENVSLPPIRQSLRMLLSVQDADRQPRPRENPKWEWPRPGFMSPRDWALHPNLCFH